MEEIAKLEARIEREKIADAKRQEANGKAAIDACRKNHEKLPRRVLDRFAIIAETTGENIRTIGVQYWTQEQIERLTMKNSDGTTSTYLTEL